MVGERAGIVNLGLEGIMLIGAATGFAATALTGNPYLGLLAAAFAGTAVNLIFAYLVDRAPGQPAGRRPLPDVFRSWPERVDRPSLCRRTDRRIAAAALVPVSPPTEPAARLLSYDILVYLAAPTAALIWWLLFRTRWGLVLRAVGENPASAFAAGYRPASAAVPGAGAGRLSWAALPARIFRSQ